MDEGGDRTMSEYCGDLPLSKLFFSESLFEKFVLSPFRSRNFFCLSLSLSRNQNWGLYRDWVGNSVSLFCDRWGMHNIRPAGQLWPAKAFFWPAKPKMSSNELGCMEKKPEWVKTYWFWPLDMPKKFGPAWDLSSAPPHEVHLIILRNRYYYYLLLCYYYRTLFY